MGDTQEKINIFDPTGMMKSMRDLGIERWSKMMGELVSSEAYAEANAEMLNAWMATSAPFRKTMETVVNQSLVALNLASRNDYIRMAERLTNVEMRLDDMDAKLDEIVRRLGPHDQR